MNKFNNIPTSIISGFLGAGKTTAIKKILQQKPESERWAVIVNEFGQVGIDGALLKNDDVEIKEIAGGCLCCVGSQSLSVGLNQIIRTVKPHRILIEPTGLGHPQKLVDSLTGAYYQSVLNLKAIINLLDARQLKDPRYTAHQAFIDQVMLADILIANKVDTYSEDDRQRFYQYAASISPVPKVFMVEQAQLELEWLDCSRNTERQSKFPQAHEHKANGNKTSQSDIINTDDWLVVEGAADAYVSIGWVINTHFVFKQESLLSWLGQISQLYKIERIKGVMNTANGWISINMTLNEKEMMSCNENTSSILEFLSSGRLLIEPLDTRLRQLIISPRE